MTSRSLANTVYLKCLAFTLTILLAAPDVWAEGATYKVCYDSKKQQVTCTRKKAIIVGTIISSLFVLLGALYLYATWSDRRKKRKARSAAEENDPLSDGTVNDFEKGIARANQQENRDGFMQPDKSDGSSVSRTSSAVSDLSNYAGPPGFAYKPLEMSDSGHASSTNP